MSFISVRQACKALGVSRQRVHEMIRGKRFPNAMQDGRLWFLPQADIEALLQKKKGKSND